MQSEFDGLRNIRSALAFLVISQVLLEAGAVFLLFLFFAEDVTYVLVGGLIILVAFSLYFLSLAKFRSGFKLLRSFYKHLGIGYLGVNVIITGYALIPLLILYDIHMVTSNVVGTFNLQLALPPIFYLFNALVALVPALGNILMMLGVYRIGNTYNEANVRVGGMLIIVGSILSIAEMPIEIYGYLVAPNFILPAIIIAVSLFVANSVLFFIGALLAYQGLSKILRK